MGGQHGFHGLAGNRRHDNRGAVFVAYVVLNNKDRTNAALFAADDGV
jgi:hypothetical protein